MSAEKSTRGKIEAAILEQRNSRVLAKMALANVEFRPENEVVSVAVSLETKAFPGEDSLRYDDQGEIFIRSFQSANIDRLIQIPNKIPGKGIPKVEFVRFTPHSSIENAIKASDHIADRYEFPTGGESFSATKIIKLLQRLSSAYQDPTMTENGLSDFFEIAVREIDEAGFDKAQLPWKKYVKAGIMKSFNKDSLGRRNKPAQRFIVSHLYPLLTEARVVNRLTKNKYRRIAFKLMNERMLMKGRFEDCIAMIDEIRNLDDIEFSAKRKDLLRFAYFQMGKDAMKFAPYSGAAAKIRFLLLGQKDQIATLKKYIGEDANKYSTRKEFTLMDVGHQKVRLNEINRILEQTLLQGENDLLEGEDDWIWKKEW